MTRTRKTADLLSFSRREEELPGIDVTPRNVMTDAFVQPASFGASRRVEAQRDAEVLPLELRRRQEHG